jgi:hypothetical protein
MAAIVGRTTNNIVAAHSGSPDKKSDTFGSFPREAPGVAQVIRLPEFDLGNQLKHLKPILARSRLKSCLSSKTRFASR